MEIEWSAYKGIHVPSLMSRNRKPPTFQIDCSAKRGIHNSPSQNGIMKSFLFLNCVKCTIFGEWMGDFRGGAGIRIVPKVAAIFIVVCIQMPDSY
jgi:hypothetical protein